MRKTDCLSQEASRHIQSLLSLFVIAPVNRLVLEHAIASKFQDFEDAVLHAAACHAGAKYIVTRNVADFRNAKLPVFEPKEFINTLELLNK
jgi:predicted nucleic acid-binding protein